MKKSLTLLLTFALGATLMAAEAPSREEIAKSIAKGLAYLEKQQQPDGSFANPENKATSQDHPALTAMPLMAFQRDPNGARQTDLLQKGYAFIRSKAQPDGGIYSSGLSNYNTSVCLMALLSSGDPKDEPLITKARAFVAGQQATNMLKPENDGGFGYGPTGTSPKRQHPDLDNTLVALEALHEYRLRRPATELAKDKDLDFKAAIDFVSRCQNLPATNPLPGANGDAANKGGFVYYPGYSNAGEEKLPDGRTALRSYGSMSYAGLLSFIYADLDKGDQRVVAALDWLSKNYTLEENPALGPARHLLLLQPRHARPESRRSQGAHHRQGPEGRLARRDQPQDHFPAKPGRFMGQRPGPLDGKRPGARDHLLRDGAAEYSGEVRRRDPAGISSPPPRPSADPGCQSGASLPCDRT